MEDSTYPTDVFMGWTCRIWPSLRIYISYTIQARKTVSSYTFKHRCCLYNTASTVSRAIDLYRVIERNYLSLHRNILTPLSFRCVAFRYIHWSLVRIVFPLFYIIDMKVCSIILCNVKRIKKLIDNINIFVALGDMNKD